MISLDLSKILRRFQRNWTEELKPREIEKVCLEHGLRWRIRLLDPVRTIQLFLLQILHGNTACNHLPHLSRLKFSASGYCQARKRLPLEIFQSLLNRIGEGIKNQECEDTKWRGHRTLLLDGSSFSMPDNAHLQRHFGQPSGQSKGCGFPVSHLLALFDAGTGMISKVLNSPLYTHDMSRAEEIHPELLPNDLLLADRGFCSFSHICLLLQRQVHSVMRLNQSMIVNFRAGRCHTTQRQPEKGKPRSIWLKKLGLKDQLVIWTKPKKKNWWISPTVFSNLPDSIVVRELSYSLAERGFRTKKVTLVTTLLAVQEYPAEALAELYGLRWSVETNFRHLKTTMGMNVLRCETVQGVLKELCLFCIIYNLVRLVMIEAAKKQNQPLARISFIDALRWLVANLSHSSPLVLNLNPSRPNRVEPRAVKRRPKKFERLKIPRHNYRVRQAFQ